MGRDWTAYKDPCVMLDCIGHRLSERKKRLIAVACCRRVWPMFIGTGRAAVVAAERYADRRVTAAVLKRAQEAVIPFPPGVHLLYSTGYAASLASHADKANARWVMQETNSASIVSIKAATGRSRVKIRQEVHAEVVSLLRNIVGDPLRSVPLSTGHFGRQVVDLAKAAYNVRDKETGQLVPASLWVLADAVEESGLASGDLLAHLRSPGPHYRGMWSLDWLLCKE